MTNDKLSELEDRIEKIENTNPTNPASSHNLNELEHKVSKIQTRIPLEHKEKHKELENKIEEVSQNCNGHQRYQKFEERIEELEDRIKEFEKKAKRAENISEEVADEWDDMIRDGTNIPEEQLKQLIREIVKEELDITVKT